MEKPKPDRDVFDKTKAFLEIFKKGEAFTHDLIKENERLSDRVAHLEQQAAGYQENLKGNAAYELQKTVDRLQKEKKTLEDRLKDMEAENKDFAEKYIEVEGENNNLANLYVASYQLHSTLIFDDVLRILQEIVINLVGSDRFAFMLMDEKDKELVAATGEGIDLDHMKRIKRGEGVIGDVAKTGESYFEPDVARFNPKDELDPLVCIPLKIKDRVIGVLAIFELMEQKDKKLSRVDYDLFSMLAGHAATAIFSARLYSMSERKLSTIQGFIDLLSSKPE